MGKLWTKDDDIVAYALYCITPFSKINTCNKMLLQVAEILSCPLNSLILKMQTFQKFDPAAEKMGKFGFGTPSRQVEQVYKEFKNDRTALIAKVEKVIGFKLPDSSKDKGAKKLSSLTDRYKVNREWLFFRELVLPAYEYTCCISGFSIPMDLPNMIVASHIKPYNACHTPEERTNPENGLCLSVFYDKAFDQGIITIDTDYKICIASDLKKYENIFTRQWLVGFEGAKIILPKRFLPGKEFLAYHNEHVFERWKKK